jgi:hypothetical protein
MLAALLLVAIASRAYADWDPQTPTGHAKEADGVWNKRFWHTVGVPSTDPRGVAFDPLRAQLIRFGSDWIGFLDVDSLGLGRGVQIRDWPGIPVAYSAIYDPRRDRIVLLTLARRSDPPSVCFDVFALRLSDPVRWELLVPSGTSPNLGFASAIYDPVRDCMLIYGGADVLNGNEVRGEIWVLSLGDHPFWTRIEPRGVAPPPRMGHTAIYDAEHREMVVYGGQATIGAAPFGDVWTLDLGPQPRWRRERIQGPAPGSRAGHTAIYDARRERMLVTGGLRDNYVWALSLRGVPRWSRVNPLGEAPPAGSWQIAFADAVNDRMVLTDKDGGVLWTLDWGCALRAPWPDLALQGPLMAVDREGHDGSRPSLDVSSSVWRGGVLRVRVSLPEASNARLDLFDLAGRRIWTAGSNAIGPGTHDVAIAPSISVGAGVYFVRLEQRTYSTVRKILRLP